MIRAIHGILSKHDVTILNDYANMSLMYGFDDANYFTIDGSNNIVSPFVKDRSPSDVTFNKTGTLPYDATKKAVSLTASGILTHTNAPFLKGNTIIALAFRHVFDYSTFRTMSPTVYPLYKDGSYYFGYTEANTYVDNMFNALGNSATRGRTVYEIGGHTVVMWVTDGTYLYYYINNVLKSTTAYTGTATDIRGLTGIMPFLNNFPNASVMYLNEVRIYNKIYTSDERTTLFSNMASRYSLDAVNYPTASGLSIVGTVSAGNTVTLSYTYNQNGASAAGDFYIIYGWYYNASLSAAESAWKNTILTGSTKNSTSMTVPSVTTGYYFYAMLIVYDNQGRTSKLPYKISQVIVAA
jgi:hypothetical protein